MHKKQIIFFFTIILIFSCSKKSSGLKESDVPFLVRQFLDMHVQYHDLDDMLSERILNIYINTLDYGKYFFHKSDVDSFMKHSKMIDDYIIANNFKVIYQIFDVYKGRFKENMKLFNNLITMNYDFNLDEKIDVDRDSVDYATNDNDMKERWRKNIKLQLLNYISSGVTIENAKTKLSKKYSLLEKRMEEIGTEKILERFINSFTMALDPHSSYMSAEENEDFKISMELKLEGIGVRLRSEDGFVHVESIIPGGASDKLPENIKLKPNDKIIAVSQGSDEPSDVIDMDLRDVVKKIRGRQGTEVRLTILRESDKAGKPARMIIPIIREEIKLQDSDAESDVLLSKKYDFQAEIGYIRLPSFYKDPQRDKSSAGDMRQHIDSLVKKGVKGIILDLRGNPGGLLNEAIQIAGLFIEYGPILQVKDSRHAPQVYEDTDSRIFYDGPIVVLIDKFSASASEILAGAIKDYNRGLILGPGNTFGKGTVQSYNTLGNRLGAVKVTTHIFYQPSGSSNQLNGIEPDIIIPSMTSIWDIGENKTKYPLSWVKIASASYKKYYDVNPIIISSLKDMSSRRINSNSKFIDLMAKIRKYKEQLKNKSISLKEESNIEKQKMDEFKDTSHKKKKVVDLENDLFLQEAFNITIDYLKYKNK